MPRGSDCRYPTGFKGGSVRPRSAEDAGESAGDRWRHQSFDQPDCPRRRRSRQSQSGPVRRDIDPGFFCRAGHRFRAEIVANIRQNADNAIQTEESPARPPPIPVKVAKPSCRPCWRWRKLLPEFLIVEEIAGRPICSSSTPRLKLLGQSPSRLSGCSQPRLKSSRSQVAAGRDRRSVEYQRRGCAGNTGRLPWSQSSRSSEEHHRWCRKFLWQRRTGCRSRSISMRFSGLTGFCSETCSSKTTPRPRGFLAGQVGNFRDTVSLFPFQAQMILTAVHYHGIPLIH